MSYILDALRRAEAEREQEKASVPGVHSAVLSDLPMPPVAKRSASRAPLAWGLGVIAVVVVAVGAWWLGRSATPVAPSPAPAPAPTAVTAAVPAAPRPAAPMAPPPAPVAAPAERVPAPAPVVVPPSHPPSPPVAVAPAAPVPPPPAAAMPTYRELPEATRRQLSPLTVGGAMHSPDPASRMLILNGQVVRQGDTVAPGLVLEEIQPRAAVLVFQGQRFTLPY